MFISVIIYIYHIVTFVYYTKAEGRSYVLPIHACITFIFDFKRSYQSLLILKTAQV